MSDTRFTILGIILIFAGFIVLSIFGSYFQDATIQEQEFGDCLEYSQGDAVKVECSSALQYKTLFFIVVIGLIILGILSLIKGTKGRWDQDVDPKDVVGPKKYD